MFNFRIIDTVDGNQIIDRNLKTPYSSLTPVQMVEYIEISNQILVMDRMKRRQEREAKKRNTWYHRLAVSCGILQKGVVAMYITYKSPFVGQTFTEKQMQNVYANIVDKEEYPDFAYWKEDMLRSGVFEKNYLKLSSE